MLQTLEPAIASLLFARTPAPESPPWRNALNAGFSAALDLLFPPHCISCSEPLLPQTNTALCRDCAQRVRWIGDDRCRRCGAAVGCGSGAVDDCPECRSFPPAYVKASCSVAHYADGPLRDVVLALKFSRKVHLALPVAKLIALRLRQAGLAIPGTVVVPVPLTPATLRERSFNQSQEIAALIARELKLPLQTRLLSKIRATAPQAVLSAEQRRTNLKGAFACNPRRAAKFQGARVLLIDDVITTCSTVSECARSLVAAGIGEVYAASLARG